MHVLGDDLFLVTNDQIFKIDLILGEMAPFRNQQANFNYRAGAVVDNKLYIMAYYNAVYLPFPDMNLMFRVQVYDPETNDWTSRDFSFKFRNLNTEYGVMKPEVFDSFPDIIKHKCEFCWKINNDGLRGSVLLRNRVFGIKDENLCILINNKIETLIGLDNSKLKCFTMTCENV